MAFTIKSAGDILGLLDVKAPISQTSDGGYALTIGLEVCNVGVKVGGNTGIEAFCECGPIICKVGIDQNVNAYIGCGIEGLVEGVVSVGLSGVSAVVQSDILGAAGGFVLNGSGLAVFSQTKGEDLCVNMGSEEAFAAGEQLIQTMASLCSPTSGTVPSVVQDVILAGKGLELFAPAG
jgi:hypothetical protein